MSITSWLEAALLGGVQGITEFLPVSSSAHLRIIGPMRPSGVIRVLGGFKTEAQQGFEPFL